MYCLSCTDGGGVRIPIVKNWRTLDQCFSNARACQNHLENFLQVVLELQAVRLQLGLGMGYAKPAFTGTDAVGPGYHSEIYCFKCHGEN